MNPAQKLLQEKLARLRATKDASSNSGNASNEPAKQSGETPQTRIEESKTTAQESKELQVSEGVPTTVQPREESVSICQQHANQEGSEAKNAEVTGTDHPIKMQLAELEAALNDKQPGFKTILRDIHTKLRQDPAIVTLLTDEEIGGILAGLKHHAQVDVIAPKAAKTAKKETKAKIANMSADDL